MQRLSSLSPIVLLLIFLGWMHPNFALYALLPSFIWGLWLFLAPPAHVGAQLLTALFAPPIILSSLYGFWLTQFESQKLYGFALMGIMGVMAATAFIEKQLPSWWRQRATTSLISAILMLSIMSLQALFNPPPLLTERDFYQQIPAAQAPVWSEEDKQQALDLVQSILRKGSAFDVNQSPQFQALANLEQGHGVVVSIYTQKPFRRLRGVSYQEDTRQALVEAISTLMQEARNTFRYRSIQIDILSPALPITPRSFYAALGAFLESVSPYIHAHPYQTLWAQLALELEPGIDGLILSTEGQQRVMLPTDPFHQGWWTPRVRTKPSKWRAAFKGLNTIPNEGLQLSKIRSLSFGKVTPQGELVTWFRGKELLPELQAEALIESIEEGAYWLLHQVRSSGAFRYEYFPHQNRYPSTYNVTRHAGTVYSLFYLEKWARERGDKKRARLYGRIGRRAWRWMLPHIKKPTNAAEGVLCLDAEKSMKSGASALALLGVSLAMELHPDWPYAEHIRGLEQCLINMVDSRGAVFRSWKEAQTQEFVEKEPLYYPGETLLALTSAYAHTQSISNLETAKLVGDYRLEAFSSQRRTDHWVIQALYELYRLTEESKYAEANLTMARRFMTTQVEPQQADFPDEVGSFQRLLDVARTTRAGSRMEAIASAWKVAKLYGVDPAPFARSLRWGAQHLLEQQFGVNNSHFAPKPKRMLGAVPMGIVDIHCRIDNNQHVLVGLIGALEAIEDTTTHGGQ